MFERSLPWIQRILGAGVLALALLEFFHSGTTCPKAGCPSYAFGSDEILRAERAAVTYFIAFAIYAITWHVVVLGEVPISIGKDGFGWADGSKAIEANTNSIGRVEKMVEELSKDLDGVRSNSTSADEELSQLVVQLETRLANLEGDAQPGPAGGGDE